MVSLVNVNRPTVGAYAKQVSHGGIFSLKCLISGATGTHVLDSG